MRLLCGLLARSCVLLVSILLSFTPLTPVSAAPPAPHLVADINQLGLSATPSNFAQLNGTLYFAAFSLATGTELWKSDGTLAGTVLVKDITPGSESSFPEDLAVVGGTLFFSAHKENDGRELWKSDGTAGGTVLVKDIWSGDNSSSPQYLTGMGTTLFFQAETSADGVELWKSDGTAAGTMLVKDIREGNRGSTPAQLTVVDDTLYFSAQDGSNGNELWKSDGTSTGTQLVKNIRAGNQDSSPGNLTALADILFFTANDGTHGAELWKSDGTDGNTLPVRDIRPGSSGSSATGLTAAGDLLFFTANDGTHGAELWKSNGDASDTELVEDILVGGDSSAPNSLTAVGDTLYFIISDGSDTGLWKSGGTDADTELVKNFDSSALPQQTMKALGDLLFFRAADTNHGEELWISDGTEASTLLVRDIWPGSDGAMIDSLTVVGSALFFKANSGTSGEELWKSDGTANGTLLIRDIEIGSQGSSPENLAAVDGDLYFSANDGIHGSELWKHEGASGDTELVTDIRVGVEGSFPAELTALNEMLFFRANDGSSGDELWTSDGTAGGTHLVQDIRENLDGSFPENLTVVGTTLYFRADDGTHGIELWKSGGTAASTELVKDIWLGVDGSFPDHLTVVGDTLFFVADDGLHGAELWISDGTAGGTMMVKDIRTGSDSSSIDYLTALGEMLYFHADDGIAGSELWRSDGTPDGTQLVLDIQPGINGSVPEHLTASGNKLYFRADDGTIGIELWQSNGAQESTQLVKDIWPGSGSAVPSLLTSVGGILYFAARDGTSGLELWRSDGTAAGTLRVLDIAAGSKSSSPDLLTAANGLLFFRADDGINGNELWVSNGTLTEIIDLGPGPNSSNPQWLTAVESKLYFRASDANRHGEELWALSTLLSPQADDNSYTTDEETPLAIAAPGVLEGDSDFNGDALSAVLAEPVAFGTLDLEPDGSFVYTPTLNFNGTDSFTYQASDGSALSNLATVTITVNSVNDAPSAGDNSYSTGEDTSLSIAAAGVLNGDSDIDGDPLSAVLVDGVDFGLLALNANGSFVYTPTHNFNGVDSFTYKADDGSALSNLATVTLTVTPANDAPFADNESYSTGEDTPLTIAAIGVLQGDSDADGDPLTAVLVDGVDFGLLTFKPNGSFIYTPTLNFHGSDSFTYRANDGNLQSNIATVTISVNSVNDAPLADGGSYSTSEDGVLTIAAPGVLVGDSDVDGDALGALLVDDVNSGVLTLKANGSFVYTPTLNFHGNDSFSYKTSDGQAQSNVVLVTIAVSEVNDAPVADDDRYSATEDTPLTIAAAGVLVGDSDVDGDALSASLVDDIGFGVLTFKADGSFVYTPTLNFNGTDSFTYRASDDSALSNLATVIINVSSVNDLPSADDESYQTDEDTALTIVTPGVLAGDSDVDGDSLSAVLVDDIEFGKLALNINGSFVYTPALNFHGSDSFTYQAGDGVAHSNMATVSIVVNSINDVPTADDDSYHTDEDTALTVAAPGILEGDSDVDGDPLSAVLVDDVDSGTLSLKADGSFTYTPAPDFNGGDTFTYKASDGVASSNLATVTIAVDPINDAPVARIGSSQEVLVNLLVTLDGTSSSDPDGHLPLTYGWTQKGGPSVNFPATSSMTTFTSPSTPAVLVFALTVADALGLASTPISTVVTVRDVSIAGLEATNDGPTEIGDSTTLAANLSAGSNVTYHWNFGDVSSANGVTAAHTYGAVGTYIAVVTAVNSRGTVSDTTLVTIRDVAIAGLSANNNGPAELGGAIHFAATISAGSNVTYDWNFGDGSKGSGASPSHLYGAVGTYIATVTATNSRGAVQESTVVTVRDVTISNLVATNNGPRDLGSATTLAASISAGTNVVYNWNFGDGSSGSGATSSHTYAAIGEYVATVTASNGRGEVSASTLVRVRDVGISNLLVTNDGPVELGEEITLDAHIGAGTNVKYTWDFGDGSSGAGASTSHTYAAVGDYTATVIATNGRGTASASALVTVRDVQIGNLSATNDGPAELGEATNLEAHASSGTNVEYRWDFGDGNSGVGSVVSHTYDAVGVYTATVAASNGHGTASASTLVTVNDVAIAGLDATNNGPTDLGSVTTLAAAIRAGSNVVYLWDFGDGESGTGATLSHAYDEVGEYTATVSATNGRGTVTGMTTVIVRDVMIAELDATNDSPTELGSMTNFEASISAGSNTLYTWDFGDGESGIGATLSHMYDEVGEYIATVSAANGRGTVTETTTVVVRDVVIAGLEATNDGPTILGASTEFDATIDAGSNVAYTWDFGDGSIGSGPTSSHSYEAVGEYTAIVTAANSRGTMTTTTQVTVGDVSIANLQAANDGPTLLGLATNFSANATGTNITYSWDFGDGQDGSGATPSHIYAEIGEYTVAVTAANGAGSKTTTTRVTVVDTAITDLEASNNGPTVVGTETTFGASATGSNISYRWDFGDGTTGSGAASHHAYAAVGEYTAVVTAANDSDNETASTLVIVVDTAISGLSASNNGPTSLGTATRLSASAIGSNIRYQWDFGDGNGGMGAAILHRYDAAGTYLATANASNGSDSKTASTLVIIEAGEEEVWLPPMAANDQVSTVEGLAVAGNVLINDHDPQASPLTVATFNQPAHGTLTLAANGDFTYTPAVGFAGSDQFAYVVSNSHGLTATADVNVLVAELPESGEEPTEIHWTPGVTTTQTITDHNFVLSLQMPADAYTGTLGTGETFSLLYTPVMTPTGDVDATPGDFRFAGLSFKLESYLNDTPLAHHHFATPLILEIAYPASAVEGLDPAELTLLYWDAESDGWKSDGIEVLAHDLEARTITLAISHLTEFALFAPSAVIDAKLELFLPAVSD